MGNYTETYEYDEVGSIVKMIHTAMSGSWTRQYDYDPNSNRLLLTSNPSGSLTDVYDHDAHGNMTKMPHLKAMQWNFKDHLQSVDLGGGGQAFYTYDHAGQRVRKVWEKQSGLVEERIYLGGYEIFRRRLNGNLELERETLHVMDDKRRIALVETKTIDNGQAVNSPTSLTRYQFDNHLGSAALELDEQTQVVFYEEYYPYGNTSYQAVAANVDVSLKRYRYTRKEKDEESGLYYYGARYYAAWLGRWVSADPIGMKDGVNLFQFVKNNPINSVDFHGTQTEDIPPRTQNSPRLMIRIGNTPGNLEHPPFLHQLYGSQKVEHYNTGYDRDGKPLAAPDEPDNFGQFQWGKNPNWEYGLLFMKQKFRPDEKGFKLEAPTAVEFGLAYKLELTRKPKSFRLSANFSLTAGVTVADAKFDREDSAMKVYKPWYTIMNYSPVGFGATAVARLDATFAKVFTLFVAANVHHYQGTKVKTSIGDQRVGHLGSGEITIGAGFNIGPKRQKSFRQPHYRRLTHKHLPLF
jgi:RHS repeat-associated protein